MDVAAIEKLRRRTVGRRDLLVNGRAHAAVASLAVISPIDGSEIAKIGDASADDVSAAVANARAVFDRGDWRCAAPQERKRVLTRLAELIEREALELAVLGVRDNGTEISMALKAEPGSAAATFRYYAEAIDKVYGEIAPTAQGVLALLLREPVGVVGVIVPWNFPLMIASWKIAPALAAGNAVVLKPAETASLTLLRLGELALEAGLPPGVLNIVTGRGEVAGDALARHSDVDVLAFTGSGGVGRRLLKASAESNLKRVYLELGGKSANIVFADAPDLDAAVAGAVNGVFRNAGQVCIAGTRILVEQSIHDAFVARFAERVRSLRVGDPLDPKTQVGAVASADQLARNLKHLELAKRENARLVCGGERILEETGGFYMRPAVFTQVKRDAALAQEEVFGPLAGIIAFDTEDEAIEIANDTVFGLSGGVWSANLSRAHRVAGAMKTGLVHVNCYGGSDLTVALGGVKQSGNGYDKSLHAFDKFVNLKSVWIQL